VSEHQPPLRRFSSVLMGMIVVVCAVFSAFSMKLAFGHAQGADDNSDHPGLEIRQLRIVSGGRAKATLRVTEDGHPLLEFLNEAGKQTLSMSSGEAGGSITLNGPDGTRRIELELSEEGTSKFTIRSASGKKAYQIRVGTDNTVIQQYFDVQEHERIRNELSSDGIARSVILHESGSNAIIGSVSRDGLVNQLYCDSSGKVRASFAIDRGGDGHCDLFDQAGRHRLGLSTSGKGDPSFSLVDDRGEERLKIALTQLGEPKITLFHPDGGEALTLFSDRTGRSTLTAFGLGREGGIELGVDSLGLPVVDFGR